MSRLAWILVLVGAGVALAILIGVLGTRNEQTKTEAASSLCSSLNTLEESIQALTKIDPSSATSSDVQSDLAAVEINWSQVQSDFNATQNAPSGPLEDAWSSFTSAIKDIPNASSVSDAVNSVSSAAQELVSAAQSTASSIDCSNGGA